MNIRTAGNNPTLTSTTRDFHFWTAFTILRIANAISFFDFARLFTSSKGTFGRFPLFVDALWTSGTI